MSVLASLKEETAAETCTGCGGGGDGDGLQLPEEYDALQPHLPPLRTMLMHLAHNKTAIEGRFCADCARRAGDAYALGARISAKGGVALGDKIRALRRRLADLTQKIDVFIVVGGGLEGGYSEEDIIMVERGALAAAGAAERGRDARGERVYQCDHCPQSFQRASQYRRHVATHAAAAPAHWCWWCGARAASRELLAAHSARRHPAPAPAACALCGAASPDLASATRHVAACGATGACPAGCGARGGYAQLSAHCRAAHPAACAACLLALPDEAALTLHQLQHRQARQFVCAHDGCAQRYPTRTALMSHIRSAHAGGAAEADELTEGGAGGAGGTRSAGGGAAGYACPHCDKTFATPGAMKRHAHVHDADEEEGAWKKEPGEEGDGEAEREEGGDMAEVEYLEVETLEDDLND